MTPQATETQPGILRCYDTELFLQTIREGKENADFCIAFVHWGTEYSYDLERAQLDTGKEYLDAGADAVIGAHSHCLQGMEYYDGKPIIYSLGNYWFNEKTLDTMLLQLRFRGMTRRRGWRYKWFLRCRRGAGPPMRRIRTSRGASMISWKAYLSMWRSPTRGSSRRRSDSGKFGTIVPNTD